MRNRRSAGLVLVWLASLAPCGCSPKTSAQGTAAPAVRPGGRWEVAVLPDSRVLIRRNGAPVVETQILFWGQAWKYAATRFQTSKGPGGVTRFTGVVPDLGVKVEGEIRSPSSGQLQLDYRIETTRDLDDVKGGGIQWRCGLTSPAFGGKPGDPVLLEDNKGWRWPVAPGEEVSVRFSDPIASIFFEQNQKSTIRTLYVGQKVRRGTKSFTMTVQLPPGGKIVPSAEERYGPADTKGWYRDALRPDASPIDLGFLNAQDRPAGRRGFIRADGDRLVFGDGTPARFWGGNIAAYALFVDKREIAAQAKRIPRLGYNLMRLHHQDSMRWVKPTVIDARRDDSRHLDPAAMDRFDWWVKCLKDEGVYVWLDLHVGRVFKEGDGITRGFDEIRHGGGEAKGFNYLNPRVQELMKEHNAAFLGHVNPYTKLAYKDEPAIVGMLITNENDMTQHGYVGLPDKNNPAHSAVFMKAAQEFASATGLPAGTTWRVWEPGPSKIFLSELEHEFNKVMIPDLRRLGVKVPIATTNYWGKGALSALPALADGDVIDVHSYGAAESLSVNPRYEANYLPWIAAAQVAGKPLTITEWNVAYPAADRFTAPLYVASVASLQGWDAPMIYNYSQAGTFKTNRPDEWSTFFDPGLTGMMPAAAIAYRRGHVQQAKRTYRLEFGRDQFLKHWTPETSATLRTLTEASRIEIGLPDMKELSWDRASAATPGAVVIRDPGRDFIPEGQNFVESDTGELRRDWELGIQTIDTPRTQAAAGWIGGQVLRLRDVTLRVETKKAAVAVTSLDDRPIATSRRILISAMARVAASPGSVTPFLSEPVAGSITIGVPEGLALVSLGNDGRELPEPSPRRSEGAVTIRLPSTRGTHWLLLKGPGAAK